MFHNPKKIAHGAKKLGNNTIAKIWSLTHADDRTS